MGELKIAYSDKKITPWGGMKLLKDYMNHLGIVHYLDELQLPQPGLNRRFSTPIGLDTIQHYNLFVGVVIMGEKTIIYAKCSLYRSTISSHNLL